MEQERIVRLAFRRNAITITGICVLMLRVPALGVGRIETTASRYRGLYSWVTSSYMGQSCSRVSPQRVKMLSGLMPRMTKVHTCQVIGVFLQLLRIVHDIIFALSVLCNALTDGNKQGPRTAGRIVTSISPGLSQMVSNDFRHKLRYFVGGYKTHQPFASIGRKVTDQVFINKSPEHHSPVCHR